MITGKAQSVNINISHWRSAGGISGRRLFVSGMIVPVLMALLLFGAMSCSPAEKSPEPSPGPHIQFEQDIMDLGTAVPGEKLHAEFYFRNAGDAPLVIGEITTEAVTEGCWPPKPVVGATTLEPGQESSIAIDYTVKEVEGTQVFKYLVKSNDSTAPEKQLLLQLECVLDK